MSPRSLLSEPIRVALARPAGVTELVEELLWLCHQQRLQLDWQAEGCVVRLPGGREEVIDRPLRKSAFRAVLARVAALCNEGKPGSVSPYGGEGELTVEGGSAAVFRVSFVNTPDEQWLRVVPR